MKNTGSRNLTTTEEIRRWCLVEALKIVATFRSPSTGHLCYQTTTIARALEDFVYDGKVSPAPETE
jgi:hypothetical protein